MLKKLRKILAAIALVVVLVSFAEPTFAFSSTGSDKWVAGQYDSGIKTTDSSSKTGVIIRRLTNYTTKEKITVFCAEFGVDSSTGDIENAQHIIPTDPAMKTACKIAYFGWYSRYGEYAVDGGILTEGFKQVKKDYVFTQQMIWEVLGQSNATFIDSNIQNQYILFKNQINSNIENMQKKPSFSGTTIILDLGNTITLTDTNGVLASYTSLDKTIEGIRIVHNKGENTMTITVNNNCTLENYTISEETMKSWGFIKEESKDNDTTIFFSFKDGVQDQLYSMHYNDPVTMSMNLQINLFGKLELNKLDGNGKLIDGAIFQINGPENFSKEVTVANGKITLDNLKRGTYTIKEKIAPTGYLINTNTYTVEVVANQTATQSIVNKEPTGTISIIKEYTKTGSTPQGDAKLEGAVYKIYANEDIYNVAKTKKFYSNGDLVATRTTNLKGETEEITNLPLGKYVVKEEKAPIGYLIDESKYEVNLSYKDQYTKIITVNITSKDTVKGMQVHIYKSGIKESSGLVPGLAGAEFTIKLYTDVENAYKQGYSYAEVWDGIDEYGNSVKVDSQRVEEAQKIAPTYEKIITDKNGDTYTKNKLPYGKYIVKETKTPKDFECAVDFAFSITQDESEFQEVAKKVKHLVVNNEPLESYIKIIKKDLGTGKIITLNNAIFEIKATQDIYDRGTGKIIYKAGEIIEKKLIANSDEILLPVGSYEIIEIEAPNGFVKVDKTIAFKIEGIRDYEKNENGDYIKEIIIENEQPTGTLIVNKNIIQRESIDTSLVNINDLSGIQFKLKAKEDVIDYADGSVIYKKGQKVGTYNLDETGNLKIENLPMGIYELQEVKTLDGLILDTTKYEVKFIQKDELTKVYEQNKSIENYTTIVEFSKKDISGENQLGGAKLILVDKQGNVIDSWISTNKNYIIEGLTVGKEYTLIETESPNGYEIADPIIFKVEEGKETQLIEMRDKPIIEPVYDETILNIQTGNEMNYELLIYNIAFSGLGIFLISKKLSF